jgi:hypothetical protein
MEDNETGSRQQEMQVKNSKKSLEENNDIFEFNF